MSEAKPVDLVKYFGLDTDKTIIKKGRGEDERIDELVRFEDGFDFGAAIVHARRSKPHLHHVVREVYLQTRGSTLLEIDGERVGLDGPGEVAIIKPDQMHWVVDASKDSEFLVFTTPPYRQSDHHPVDRVEYLYARLLADLGRIEGIALNVEVARGTRNIQIVNKRGNPIGAVHEAYTRRVPEDLREKIKVVYVIPSRSSFSREPRRVVSHTI